MIGAYGEKATPMAKKSRKQLIKEAVEARSDLNIFAAVVAILEGSTVSADAQPDDFRIIGMCQRAQQKCLRRYDRALEALGEPYGGAKPLSHEQKAPPDSP